MNYYITEADLLVSTISVDGAPPPLAAGQQRFPGQPPGFVPAAPPFAGARWHVKERRWVDTRSAEEAADAGLQQVLADRHRAYPPLADFADAMYWQSRGDSSKMDAYLAACHAVKQRFPKP